MTFSRKLNLSILFFCLISFSAFALKIKLHNKPIIIDDIVAAGGVKGVICEKMLMQKHSGKTTLSMGILSERKYTVNCYIGGVTVLSFKMAMINDTDLGIDPGLYSFSSGSNGSIIINLKGTEGNHIIQIQPTNTGVSINDITNDKKVRVFEVLATKDVCRIHPRFDPDFTLMPNPVEEFINLSFSLPLSTKMDFFIVDMNNVVQISETNVNVEQGYNSLTYDATKLLQGAYVMKVNLKNTDGTLSVSQNLKFIKS